MNKTILIAPAVIVLAVLLGVGAIWAFSDKPGMEVPEDTATTSVSVEATTTSTPIPAATSTVKASTPVTKGTLAGTMTVGPNCPVERIDTPCPAPPSAYTSRKIAVYAANRTTLVTTITPSGTGTFSAVLPAGIYYVTMAAAQPGIGGARGVPATVVIKSGAVTRLNIDVDTGIR